jgi:hypothetical protein
MSLMDFVDSPPGCGRSVTDFWGLDAHEAKLRFPDEVNGDIWSTRRGLNPKFYWTGIFPFKENPYGRNGNRTRNLMNSGQKLWTLDHEAGQYVIVDIKIESLALVTAVNKIQNFVPI